MILTLIQYRCFVLVSRAFLHPLLMKTSHLKLEWIRGAGSLGSIGGRRAGNNGRKFPQSDAPITIDRGFDSFSISFAKSKFGLSIHLRLTSIS